MYKSFPDHSKKILLAVHAMMQQAAKERVNAYAKSRVKKDRDKFTWRLSGTALKNQLYKRRA
jgi:hypothetical protein